MEFTISHLAPNAVNTPMNFMLKSGVCRWCDRASDRSDLVNHQYMGFGRRCRPEVWFSTGSSLSSNASFVRNMLKINDIPVFYDYAKKDKEIFPKEDAAVIRQSIAVKDQCYKEYEAEHYFEPAFEAKFGTEQAPDVERLMSDVVPWVLERFGR